ncbi:L-sorbose 1-dehydrogenase-like [Brevipalpus obovatus]|uniref:L-sorbose 1-dehydrogenase-like n=1 Tax=Brevipalpus obovatus TaxID=246614 RepID=UPI003D9F71D1
MFNKLLVDIVTIGGARGIFKKRCTSLLWVLCTMMAIGCIFGDLKDKISPELDRTILSKNNPTLSNVETFDEIFMIPNWLDKVNNMVLDIAFAFTKNPYQIKTDGVSRLDEYDYIVIGGGTAGSIVATRLSEVPENRVLVLEAGGKENGFSQILASGSAIIKSKVEGWRLQTQPQMRGAWGMKNNDPLAAVGKMLGGSSSHNGGVWNRGDLRDYDRWAQLGADGWSYDHVFPYYVKIERTTDIGVNDYDKGYHGTRGPLPINGIAVPSIIATPLIEGARQLGWPTGDANGRSHSVFGYFWHNISNGTRLSTAQAYLAPASRRPNLSIFTHAFVHRINFDKMKRAISVTFEKNGQISHVRARKEIILSAGTYFSPKILMLSRIGPRKELERHNIPVLVESSGVGENLQDHINSWLSYTIRYNLTSVYTRPDPIILAASQFVNNRTGGFSGPSGMQGFTRTRFALDERPDLLLTFSEGLPDSLTTGFLAGYLGEFKNELIEKYYLPHFEKDGFQMLFSTIKTSSHGVVRLRSSNPRDNPIIDYRLFSNQRDLNTLVEGCKIAMKIVNSQPAQENLSAKLFANTLPRCQQYPLGSDSYCRCLSQTITVASYHPTGTCKMGSQDDLMAVVDPYLRVKGVKGLRVIDGSIMPEVTCGNTHAPVVMIGERGSDLIKGQTLKPSLPPYRDESDVLQYEHSQS